MILYLVGMSTETDVEMKKLREKINAAKTIDIIKLKKGEEDRINKFVQNFLKNIGD